MNWKRLASMPLPLILVGMLTLGCGDGDDNGEEAEGEMEMEHEAEPGVVTDLPEGSMQVDVRLQEWAVGPAQATVQAGEVYFLAENVGPEHPHEMVIIRTDAGPLDLPFEDNGVPEDDVDIIDEIEPFAVDSSASLAVNLEAGSYLLICNITETIDGEVVSHYRQGMVAPFTVE